MGMRGSLRDLTKGRLCWPLLALALSAAPFTQVLAKPAASKPATKSTAKKSAPDKKAETKSARAKAATTKSTPVRRSTKANPLKMPDSQIEPLTWHQITGWMEDDHAEAYSAFLASCRPIMRSTAEGRARRGETYQALYDVCVRAVAALPLNEEGARQFFEDNFRPVRISARGEKDGFFTGYYEPVIDGSRERNDTHTMPLYRRPSDLVTHRLRRSGGKGKAGKRVVKRATAPYFDRAQIEDGALEGRGLEICWVNPIDAFFAEIQGSVRVRLDDGKVIRLNYADKNGHAYTAVGRFLIERGYATRQNISMQKIRQYMEEFPEEGKQLRRENKSFVFFRETDLSEFEEAIGAQGISLTAARSIAVDRKLHTYGMPVFVNAYLPIASAQPDTWFRRLMIAQDTGGAIIGPARADIYLGAGEEAERVAGRFKHPGQFVMLVPNALDPAGDTDMKLPLPKPAELTIAQKGEGAPANAKPQASVDARLVARDGVETAAKLASNVTTDAGLTTGSIGNKTKPVVDVPLPKTRPAQPQSDRRAP